MLSRSKSNVDGLDFFSCKLICSVSVFGIQTVASVLANAKFLVGLTAAPIQTIPIYASVWEQDCLLLHFICC